MGVRIVTEQMAAGARGRDDITRRLPDPRTQPCLETGAGGSRGEACHPDLVS